MNSSKISNPADNCSPTLKVIPLPLTYTNVSRNNHSKYQMRTNLVQLWPKVIITSHQQWNPIWPHPSAQRTSIRKHVECWYPKKTRQVSRTYAEAQTVILSAMDRGRAMHPMQSWSVREQYQRDHSCSPTSVGSCVNFFMLKWAPSNSHTLSNIDQHNHQNIAHAQYHDTITYPCCVDSCITVAVSRTSWLTGMVSLYSR